VRGIESQTAVDQRLQDVATYIALGRVHIAGDGIDVDALEAVQDKGTATFHRQFIYQAL
jgi:hypothetical protein